MRHQSIIQIVPLYHVNQRPDVGVRKEIEVRSEFQSSATKQGVCILNSLAKTLPPEARDMRKIDRIIGQKLRLRRLELGLSQHELATALGVSYQQIQKYETGANRITCGRLHFMALALGVNILYFFSDLDTETVSGHAMSEIGALKNPVRQALIGLISVLSKEGEERERSNTPVETVRDDPRGRQRERPAPFQFNPDS